MVLLDWDDRPAVLNPDNHDSFAVLERGGPWVEVNSTDVFSNGVEMSEDEWRARFEPYFGSLDLTKVPLDPPLTKGPV